MQKQKQLTQTVSQVQFVPGLRLNQPLGQSVKCDYAELVGIGDVLNKRLCSARGDDDKVEQA